MTCDCNVAAFFGVLPFIIVIFQVDSSFLEAIPEELREELRQDLEHLKQVREAPPPQPGVNSVGGSLMKSGNGQGRGESIKLIVCMNSVLPLHRNK